MEYDEQVSARLDMSLDEIIGQEQQDGSSHLKRRKAKGGPPGPSSVPPPTAHAALYRAPPAAQNEYAVRPVAPIAPAAGAASSVPGPPLPVWRRSRLADEAEGQNGHHSPNDPIPYSVGLPAFGSLRSPQLLSESSGPLPKAVPYGYGPRCPPPTEYYESAYPRGATGEHEHGYCVSQEELAPPPVHRGHSDNPEVIWNRQATPDQSSATAGLRGLPVREADAATGGPASACLAQRKEFTVIVSNVPKDLPAVEIQEAFSCTGTVLRTDIMLNSKGEHTGRVCIAFASAEAAKTAVAQFDKGDLNGNTIRVFAE
ncbi:RNA binding motif-containing protein, putative [Eimeria brunetti]|uniref:RNA binding motif-containing protein, putative n=1 Tax=Eimeria brunetti TaxID=51314 RepID=U6LWC3_9EIME|nr:RNA binding motif-containing protein, putative [Eimeria brunetti]